MRKGEKLIKYLSEKFPVLDRYEVIYRDARLVKIIMNMTDEEFEKITKNYTNIAENEVVCVLCNKLCLNYEGLSQEQIDKYICYDCEETVGYGW